MTRTIHELQEDPQQGEQVSTLSGLFATTTGCGKRTSWETDYAEHLVPQVVGGGG